MRCRECRGQMVAGGEGGAFAEHLRTCPRCARVWRELQSASRLLRALPAPPDDEELFDRLAERIALGLAELPAPARPWRLPLAAAGAAAVLLLGLLSVRHLEPSEPTVAELTDTVAESAPATEQTHHDAMASSAAPVTGLAAPPRDAAKPPASHRHSAIAQSPPARRGASRQPARRRTKHARPAPRPSAPARTITADAAPRPGVAAVDEAIDEPELLQPTAEARIALVPPEVKVVPTDGFSLRPSGPAAAELAAAGPPDRGLQVVAAVLECERVPSAEPAP